MNGGGTGEGRGEEGLFGAEVAVGTPHMFFLAPLMLPHGHGCGVSMGRQECAEVGGFEEWGVGMPE